MNNKIYRDVHFIASENDDFFDVEEKILYGFFSYRIIKSKTGEPFSIGRIYGPYHHYYNDKLNLVGLITVTFVYHKSSDRPFVLILQKSNKEKNYYGLLYHADIKWEPLVELNGIGEHNQKKLLFDVLKTKFANLFELKIDLSHYNLQKKSYPNIKMYFKVFKDENYCDIYDRYNIKGEKTVSISEILIYGEQIEMDRSLNFVEHFYFYYSNDEYSTPLMMETVDYQIAGSLPYINYFIPESVGNKWVPVECGTDLLEPKCKSDIKRILDGVVEMYRNHPVLIDITKQKYNWDINPIVKFSGIRFWNIRENGKFYISHTFTSKVTKSFFIEHIMLDDVKQEIDIQSTEFESITVYYKVEQPHNPLMICLKLHNKTNTSVENYKWFYIPHFDKNVWLKVDFEAHPHNDNKLIEQKIKSMYGSTSIINYIMMPFKWLTFFRLMCISITFLLIKQRRRLRLILFRLYHHIR